MKPGRNEGPTGGAVGLRGLAHNVSHHSASDGGAGRALAKASMCDCTLHELADGGDPCSRAVPCLRAVGDMLRQIGVP